MNTLLVLLLCMLATQQWPSCVASRNILMERMKAEGNGDLFSVPKRMLLDTVDEGNEMETEFMFPDESDDEKPDIIIEEEKKRSKQQDVLVEAIEEQPSEEKKQKKNQEDEPSLSEIGDGKSKEEKSVGDKPKKKREKYSTKFFSAKNDSSGLSSGETWQEDGEKKKVTKKEKAVMDEKASDQPTEYKTPASADKGEVIEGFSGEVSLAETAMETGITDFLPETAEEEDESTIIKEEMQDDDAKAKKKTKKVEVKGTSKAEKLEKEGYKSKTSDEISKAKEDEVEEPVVGKKGKKGGKFEGSKSKSSEDKDLTEEAMAEVSTDEESPADLIEREMQGGVQDLVISANKARKGEGEKQDDAHTVNHITVNKSEGGKDKERPFKKLKTAKKPKLELLREADSELEGYDADEKKIKTKVKKKKAPQSELGKASDVSVMMSDSQSKQADVEGTAQSQMKKKKKFKSDKLKKEEKFYVKDENNFDVIEEGQEVVGKANEKPHKKSTKKDKSTQKEEERSYNKSEKTEKQGNHDKTKEDLKNSKFTDDNSGEDTGESKILEVVDGKISEAERDTHKEIGDPEGKQSRKSEDELPAIEKQEEKLEMEIQGIAKEAQEKAEGFNSVSKSVASSTEGVDEEDDEYSDFMQDFSDLSTKFQDTALKVADHLGPNIQKLTDTSKTYFNKANQQITESFSPLVGKQFAPFFASLLSYGLLLVPLAVVIILFEHIRAILSLQKVLLFVNIYLAAYFATLLLATFIMGEPMTFFYKSSASGYVHLQLLQALGYIIYLILQTIDLVSSCSSEACSIKVTVVLQWFVAVTIGFHYYVTIFHRAMALKGPHTNWKIYGIYSCAFLVLCLFARIKRVKKGYVQVGQADTDKKH